MIQLDFDASDAAEALGKEPTKVGYSSHEGAERADWGDDKLELVDGTHPVVYPSLGSHANKFDAALYVGSSADAGVGCDDTRGPHVELLPNVQTIPSDPAAAEKAFPWIGFEGRWGELQRAFYNGPTGPNLKTQWTTPISWSDGWRPRSYAVPTGGVFGTGATDFFCGAVEKGSAGLTALLRDPGGDTAPDRGPPGSPRVARDPNELASGRASAPRASPQMGSDSLQRRADVSSRGPCSFWASACCSSHSES